MTIHSPQRRYFLKASAAVGGGLALEFSFPVPRQRRARGARHRGQRLGGDPSRTTASSIRIARSEMGQGTFTALAQLVAEELDCDWKKVSAEFASPNEHVRRNRIWGSMSTGGSQGVRGSQDYVRKAGAAAREMLVAAAAAQWKVPAAECTVDKGVITHGPSKRRLRYGQVATAAAKLPPPEGREAARPEGLEDRRQAAAPARHPRQGARQARLRHRRDAARHAARLDRAVPGVRRQGEVASIRPQPRRCAA